MKNILTALIFSLSFSSISAQQDTEQNPLMNEEFIEELTESLMESFDFDNLQDQMLELSEQMQELGNGFDMQSFEFIDTFNGGLFKDGDFQFFNNMDHSQLQEQMKDMQKMFQPMFDSLMENGSGFQQFNFDNFDGFENQFQFNELFKNMPFDIESFGGFGGSSFLQELKQELVKDELFKEGTNHSFELTSDHLKINGEKQSKEIYSKYKELYEKSLGHELGDDFIMKLDLGKDLPKPSRKTKRI